MCSIISDKSIIAGEYFLSSVKQGWEILYDDFRWDFSYLSRSHPDTSREAIVYRHFLRMIQRLHNWVTGVCRPCLLYVWPLLVAIRSQTNLISTCKQFGKQTIFVSDENGLIIRVELAISNVRVPMPVVVPDFVVSNRANNSANSGQYLGQNWRGLISKSNALPRSLQPDLSTNTASRADIANTYADRITASIGICNRIRYMHEHKRVYLDVHISTRSGCYKIYELRV